jgi:hypothetical protein
MSIHFEDPENGPSEPGYFAPGEAPEKETAPMLTSLEEKDAYYKMVVDAAIPELNKWADRHGPYEDKSRSEDSKVYSSIADIIVGLILKHHNLSVDLQTVATDPNQPETLARMQEVSDKYLGQNMQRERILQLILDNPFTSENLRDIVSLLQTDPEDKAKGDTI